ncbi:MAG: DUF1668 domain-containing protein [Candidatus Poribacteria bacterium]|nr:DUF1668 domain-containing protein [Candidatus Poribacteria bacterium]
MSTRGFMRTAFILIVTITTLTQNSDADIGRWIQLDDGTTMGGVYVLEAWNQRLYAGTDNGIFISQNHGRTWRTTSFENEASTITIDGNTVYAGTWSNGVFRSDDAGETWKPIRDGLRTYKSGSYGDVRRILVMFNEIINVMYHQGTYVSVDQGETWHDVSKEWLAGDSIYSMTEFDGYLWSAVSIHWMYRSPDNGRSWEYLPGFVQGRVNDWEVLYNRLYVAGQEGIGRWNEKTRAWEYLMDGLPIGNAHDPDEPPFISSLAVVERRLFAGLRGHGVYVFDVDTETWSSVGLEGHSVHALLSYESSLYAGLGRDGIYCAGRSKVHPHAKAVTTWARMKQETFAKD